MFRLTLLRCTAWNIRLDQFFLCHAFIQNVHVLLYVLTPVMLILVLVLASQVLVLVLVLEGSVLVLVLVLASPVLESP